MRVEHQIVFSKTQLKAMDCWYACIEMIRSAVAGSRTGTAGNAAAEHRGASILGQKLSFDRPVGQTVMTENNLVDVSGGFNPFTVGKLALILQQYGPVIVGGKFAMFNSQGHFIVIYGCDTATGQVFVYDPGWGQGRQTKPFSYIAKHCWKVMGGDSPASGSVIADDPAAAFNAPTRGRS